jgi:aminoglycoside phosphotransferase (APT) family kinase protein
MTMDAEEATLAGLRQLGLVPRSGEVEMAALTGGVASDIWLVRAPGKQFVVKRALEKLRVAADWRAPVNRNASEVAWLRRAASAVPGAVPQILAHSPELGFFAMNFLSPDAHPVWKNELHRGRADPAFAARVGSALATIHASAANQPAMAGDFNDDVLFRALRVEPYLEFTATRHPEIAPALLSLGRHTLGTHKALVHGDVSPKNILCGPGGPVFLDAECAWYGDPAFDLAFCLNHLLLKCLWTPAATDGFLASFDALATAYLRGVVWEASDRLETRAAALLPALLLARVDGKSPVEYITGDADKELVRSFAVPLIRTAPASLAAIRSAWADTLHNGTAP